MSYGNKGNIEACLKKKKIKDQIDIINFLRTKMKFTLKYAVQKVPPPPLPFYSPSPYLDANNINKNKKEGKVLSTSMFGAVYNFLIYF